MAGFDGACSAARLDVAQPPHIVVRQVIATSRRGRLRLKPLLIGLCFQVISCGSRFRRLVKARFVRRRSGRVVQLELRKREVFLQRRYLLAAIGRTPIDQSAEETEQEKRNKLGNRAIRPDHWKVGQQRHEADDQCHGQDTADDAERQV